jgi:SPP1 family predicted phage head-tail adaptor
MRAGTLRHKLTIESPTRSDSATGDYVITWAAFVDAWGSVNPLNSRETVRVRQAELNTTHLVTIRYVQGITTDMRVRVSGNGGENGVDRLLNIVGISQSFLQRRMLELSCVEVTPAGAPKGN